MLRVLMFHRIADPHRTLWLNPGLVSATPTVFGQIAELLAREYYVASMDEALDAVVRNRPLPPRSVLLTFDDAYRDFAANAWPTLKRYGLPATLFVPTAYAGAQPSGCLRSPRGALGAGWAGGAEAGQPGGAGRDGDERRAKASAEQSDFSAAEILAEIARATPDVGIVTIASELDGGLDLVRWLSARGHRVSLGHSGATYEEALAAIQAGARHATHLFNRMPPLGHRAPGLVGAVLQTDEIAAEIICDGVHVHPALMRTAIAAKRTSRIFAITDSTAASGLPVGSAATLGGRPITAGARTALLPDGTIAGSVLTMDGAFQTLIAQVGLSLVDAATICATTPARELGLVGHGVLAPEAVADLVILDANFAVVQTYVAGQLVYARGQ